MSNTSNILRCSGDYYEKEAALCNFYRVTLSIIFYVWAIICIVTRLGPASKLHRASRVQAGGGDESSEVRLRTSSLKYKKAANNNKVKTGRGKGRRLSLTLRSVAGLSAGTSFALGVGMFHAGDTAPGIFSLYFHNLLVICASQSMLLSTQGSFRTRKKVQSGQNGRRGAGASVIGESKRRRSEILVRLAVGVPSVLPLVAFHVDTDVNRKYVVYFQVCAAVFALHNLVVLVLITRNRLPTLRKVIHFYVAFYNRKMEARAVAQGQGVTMKQSYDYHQLDLRFDRLKHTIRHYLLDILSVCLGLSVEVWGFFMAMWYPLHDLFWPVFVIHLVAGVPMIPLSIAEYYKIARKLKHNDGEQQRNHFRDDDYKASFGNSDSVVNSAVGTFRSGVSTIQDVRVPLQLNDSYEEKHDERGDRYSRASVTTPRVIHQDK